MPTRYCTACFHAHMHGKCSGFVIYFSWTCTENKNLPTVCIKMRQPGIEPGSTAWKAAMLTTIPLTLRTTWIVHIYHVVPLSTDLKTENFPNTGSLTQKVQVP